eukprot:706756-Alexandrium_andersonii.AAC.1
MDEHAVLNTLRPTSPLIGAFWRFQLQAGSADEFLKAPNGYPCLRALCTCVAVCRVPLEQWPDRCSDL